MMRSARRPRASLLGPGTSYRTSADCVALAAALRAQSRDLMERCRIMHDHVRTAAEQARLACGARSVSQTRSH